MAINKTNETNRYQDYQSLLADLGTPSRIADFSSEDSSKPPQKNPSVVTSAVVDEYQLDDHNPLKDFKSLIG